MRVPTLCGLSPPAFRLRMAAVSWLAAWFQNQIARGVEFYNRKEIKDTLAYLRFFGAGNSQDQAALKDGEPRRVALYKLAAALLRAYANLANEMTDAGYSPAEAATIKAEVDRYEKVRQEVKLASGDYIDLKMTKFSEIAKEWI